MNVAKLLIFSGVLAASGAVAWYSINRPAAPQALVGIDPSSSLIPNCSGVRAVSQRLLEGLPGVRDGSTFSVFVMGTDRQNPDPTLGFSGPIPIEPDTVFGSDPEAFREKEKGFFDEVEKACSSAKAGANSPIYALVKQGLAHLKNDQLRCGPSAKCRYLIRSDLDEDLHEGLRAIIRQSVKNPGVAVPPELAGSLDNSGIEVTACGISEVKQKSRSGETPSTTDARIRIWKTLFTHPELTAFRLFCN